ncbi:HAD-IA family hydrolase [Actinomycetospora lemnae]|uniref:HAD-IA family hydrolase n=1 Tax=Actinomycetospora lemnae TaxID=3019891 RepID=UPI0038CC0079
MAPTVGTVPARAILFDLDGTLVDSAAAIDRSWMTWANEYGLDPLLVRKFSVGRTVMDTVSILQAHTTNLNLEQAVQRQIVIQCGELDDVFAMPGAHELVSSLHGLGRRWGVVTGAYSELARLRINAAGLPHPSVLVCSDDVTRGKPMPDGFLLAASLLGVSPRECLVVEDSAVGVAAGRSAGAVVVGVGGAAGDFAVDSLRDVSALLSSSH